MINLHIISTSRADFGIQKELIKKIQKDKRFKGKFIISGSHLSKKYGHSVDEINLEKIRINKKIYIKCKATGPSDSIADINDINKDYSKYLLTNKPDIVIVFGDRYEMLSFVLAAYLHGVPIAHIHGGEVTKGSLDDGIRNAITKLANIHFVSNPIHKKRVEQMGEEKSKVIDIGYLSHETIRKTKLISKKKLEDRLDLVFEDKIIVINLYSETSNKKKTNIEFCKNLTKFLKQLKNTTLIFTKPGSDVDNIKIYNFFLKSFKNTKNCFFFKSLGSIKYLSLLNFSNIMIGNSSSGIYDMPFFLKPSINIGERQFGRVKFYSVIDVGFNINNLKKKFEIAMSQEFLKKIKKNNKINKKNIDPSKKIIDTMVRLNFEKLNPKNFVDLS
jgi:GDP/UDP-N,N'-diacetylbacillosamine 2-epimerase (hydrolysing)